MLFCAGAFRPLLPLPRSPVDRRKEIGSKNGNFSPVKGQTSVRHHVLIRFVHNKLNEMKNSDCEKKLNRKAKHNHRQQFAWFTKWNAIFLHDGCCVDCVGERERKKHLWKNLSSALGSWKPTMCRECTTAQSISMACLLSACRMRSKKKRLSKAKTLQPFWDGLFVELLPRVSIERAIHFNWCRMWMKWLFWIQKISNTFKSNTNVVRRICACRGSTASSTILVECKIWLRCCPVMLLLPSSSVIYWLNQFFIPNVVKCEIIYCCCCMLFQFQAHSLAQLWL